MDFPDFNLSISHRRVAVSAPQSGSAAALSNYLTNLPRETALYRTILFTGIPISEPHVAPEELVHFDFKSFLYNLAVNTFPAPNEITDIDPRVVLVRDRLIIKLVADIPEPEAPYWVNELHRAAFIISRMPPSVQKTFIGEFCSAAANIEGRINGRIVNCGSEEGVQMRDCVQRALTGLYGTGSTGLDSDLLLFASRAVRSQFDRGFRPFESMYENRIPYINGFNRFLQTGQAMVFGTRLTLDTSELLDSVLRQLCEAHAGRPAYYSTLINQHPVLSKGYLTGPLPAQSGESSPGMMPLTEFLVTDPIACSYFYLTRRSLSEALTGLGIFKPVGKPNVTDFDALILPLEKVANVLRKADPLSSEKECLTVVERYLMLAVIDLFSAPPASPGIESTRNNLRTRFAESMDTICSEGLKKIGPKILSRWVKATHSMPIPTPLIARILESLEDKVAARFLTIGAKTKAMKAFFGAAIAHNLNGVHRLIDLAAQAAPSLISEPLAYDLHALRIAARDPRPNAIVDRLIRVMPLEILFTKDPFQKSLIYRIIEDPRTSDVALIKIIDAVLAQNPRAVGIPINSYPDYERSWGDNLLMAAARFGRDQLVGHLMTQMDARAMRYRDSFGDTVFSVINGPRWAITERGWETSYENRFNRAFSIAVPYLRREPSGIPKSAKKLSFNRDRPLNFKHRHFVAFNLPDNPDRRMVYQVRMELFKNNVTRRMILADVRKLIGTGINKKLYSISE